MKLVEAVRRANAPGPPEDSIPLRVGCTCSVLVAIAACADLDEISKAVAAGAAALIAIGMVFSYRLRARPPSWTKFLVAAGAVAALVWFFHQVNTPNGNTASVEDPLAELLVFVQVVHSFHVPARYDLLFSIAAAAGLMTVAAAQAVDPAFALFVVAWAGVSLSALTEAGRSAAGRGRTSARGATATIVGVTAVAAAAFLALPAPTVAVRFDSLTRAGLGGRVPIPGALAGDGGSPAQLARAGSPSGATRIGGYLGFANSLDTALRGSLSHQVVMWVRAQRPTYFVGETFDSWNGLSWTRTNSTDRPVDQSSPLVLPIASGETGTGRPDLQTFYITRSTADLIFHADTATELWFPTSTVFTADDGTIVSPVGLGQGTIYSVESHVDSPSPNALRHASGPPLDPVARAADTALPRPYARVATLARSITAKATTNYGRIEALIAWIGSHTHYSTTIPPLPAGTDTVDEFLFGERVGFCEQISTSLAVMARTLGIPAREAVGYVPGPYNPVTDLYEVQADDAHAWVQVWFPGAGWQSFDPTAVVPDANPSPASTALTDLAHGLGRIPLLPAGLAMMFIVGATTASRRRSSRPATWAERVARDIERAGRRAGQPRRSAETLSEYVERLKLELNVAPSLAMDVVSILEASAYGNDEPGAESQRELRRTARQLRFERPRKAAAKAHTDS